MTDTVAVVRATRASANAVDAMGRHRGVYDRAMADHRRAYDRAMEAANYAAQNHALAQAAAYYTMANAAAIAWHRAKARYERTQVALAANPLPGDC